MLANRSEIGIELAYQQAIALNPNNVEALGATRSGSWCTTATKLRTIFAKRFSATVRSLSRYLAYAEYLAIIEDMEAVREVGRQIESRFPDARGYRALARVYELTGEIDVGIAWGLKAFREQPSDDETRGQVGELYARIGEFETAAAYDPGPRMYQLYYQRRYKELVDLAQDHRY